MGLFSKQKVAPQKTPVIKRDIYQKEEIVQIDGKTVNLKNKEFSPSGSKIVIPCGHNMFKMIDKYNKETDETTIIL